MLRSRISRAFTLVLVITIAGISCSGAIRCALAGGACCGCEHPDSIGEPPCCCMQPLERSIPAPPAGANSASPDTPEALGGLAAVPAPLPPTVPARAQTDTRRSQGPLLLLLKNSRLC